MMVRTPRPSSPSRIATVPSNSSSDGRVGPVAELVLEPDHVELVAGAVGQHPGYDEAGDALRGLGQHEEDVVHRRRGEPLVAVQGVLTVGASRPGLGDVGPDVGAALLLRHAHAAQRTGLVRGRPQPRVVGRRGQQRRPLLGQGVVDPQRRDRGVGHRDRAAVARLGVRPGQEAGRAAQVRVGVAVGLPLPGGRSQPVADRALHEPVPGRVELDLVDPVAVAVVRRQLRVVLVGQPALLARLRAAGLGAQREQPFEHLGGAVADHGLAEREVRGDDVVARQRWHLVGGRAEACTVVGPHGSTVEAMVAEPLPGGDRPGPPHPSPNRTRNRRRGAPHSRPCGG